SYLLIAVSGFDLGRFPSAVPFLLTVSCSNALTFIFDASLSFSFSCSRSTSGKRVVRLGWLLLWGFERARLRHGASGRSGGLGKFLQRAAGSVGYRQCPGLIDRGCQGPRCRPDKISSFSRRPGCPGWRCSI